jgi:hypothetical protein
MNLDDPTGAYDLFNRLSAFNDPATMAQWYATPNEAFGGRSPNTVIVDGDIELLWRMLYQLESGVAS